MTLPWLSIIVFLSGIIMYALILFIFGWWGLISSIPLAYLTGWAAGELYNWEERN